MSFILSPAPLAAIDRRRGRAFRLAAVGALFLFSLPALAQDRDPVVARVDGVEIRQSDLAIAEKEFGAQLPGENSEAKRDALITFYSDMILLARAAQAKGLGSTVEFSRKLAFARSRLLMDAMLDAEAKTAVTDGALRKVYDEAVKEIGKQEEVHARHILVETEEEAKAVRAALDKGADFAVLAKEKSKDPGGQNSGGDLGYFSKDQMVPEFAEAAFNLPKGQLSQPVKSAFGWHIIRVEDKRTKPVPTFDQVRPQLVQFVARRAQADMVSKLREKANIERLAPAENK